jgi:hypothetical protein
MSAVSALCLVHCSGTSGDKVTFLSGSTGYPANGVIGRNEIPLSDASLVFDDVTPSNARELRSEPVLGSTDANGNYSTSIEDTKVVILSAERLLADRFVQTSALIFTDGTIRVEPLNGVTTLAARSVKLAIEQRVIGTSDLTEPKIRQANQLAAEIAS